MLRQLLSALNRRPGAALRAMFVAAVIVLAMAMAVTLVVLLRRRREGFKYNCEESWATCKSDNAAHCYWGGGKKDGDGKYEIPATAGMCCPRPWSSSAADCSAPKTIRRNVVFYDNANYTGAVWNMDVTDMPVNRWDDRYGFPNFGAFNDKITAVRVPYGYKVTVWENAGYTGKSLDLEADTPDLTKLQDSNDGKGWSDRISSAKVFRKF